MTSYFCFKREISEFETNLLRECSVCFLQCKFMPFTGDCHMVSCAREGHVRLAELSSTGTCKTTRKLAQHHGAAHKVSAFCVLHLLSFFFADFVE